MKWFARRTRDRSGFPHQSQGEAMRADELLLLECAGEITDLEQQPRIELVPTCFYKADFRYRDVTMRASRSLRTLYAHAWIVEDFKGAETERFRMICRLWPFFGPGILRITKMRQHGSVIVREIVPLDVAEALEQLRVFRMKQEAA